MKILCAEYNQATHLAIIPVGDNALLRNNDDFYVPEFATEVSCVPQVVVRICKLGKSVGVRFAGRYYEEIGAGIRFYADNLEQELQAGNLPRIMASSFDGSAAISRLWKREGDCGGELIFSVNGKNVYEGRLEDLPLSVDQLVAFASDFYTLKIGDFLYCGSRYRYSGLQVGDRLQLRMAGMELMDFRVR